MTNGVTPSHPPFGGPPGSEPFQIMPSYRAETVTDTADGTGNVRTANVTRLAPAGTVALPGGAASDGMALVRETTAPPAGAGAGRTSVPVEYLPPGTLGGVNERPTGITQSAAVRICPAAARMGAY